MKKQKDEVIVTFNGKKHTLNELVKIETAAADEDAYWQEPVDQKDTSYQNTEVSKRPRFRKKPKKIFHSKHRQSKSPFTSIAKSFWIPLLSAIVVGLGLGFTVLVFFSHHNIKGQSTPGALTNSQQQQQTTSNSTGRVVGSDLSLNTEVVQTAAVTSAQQASDIEKQMSKMGIPAVKTQAKDKTYTYVFSGLAITKGNAKQIGAIYQGQGAKVYVKPWSIESSGVKLPSEVVHQVLKSERDTLELMIAASSELMVNHSVSTTIQKDVKKGTVAVKQSAPQTPKNIQALANQIDGINNLINVAIKSTTAGNTRLIQQKLLAAVVSYQQLMMSYKK